MEIPKNLFVTGNPGVGKTTLIKECVLPFRDNVGGFITQEIRDGSERLGFEIETFDGHKGLLAKKGLKSDTKLNKYGIDLRVLEEIAVPSLHAAVKEEKLVIIDEIGTMEMMSDSFCATVTQLLMGPASILATIRLKAEPFTSQVKKMSDTKILTLDRDNFPTLKLELRRWIEEKMRRHS